MNRIDPEGGRPHGHAHAEPIADPAPRSSFGAIGSFYRVASIEPKGAVAMLTATLDPKKHAHVDATTLAWYRIDPKRGSFEMLDSSRLDLEKHTIHVPIHEPGIYGVYGFPKHPAVLETVRLLYEAFPLIQRERARGTRDVQSKICQLILCSPPWDLP